MKKGILFFALTLLHLSILAQQARVTGFITDSKDKSPLPGVNLLLMQTSDTTKFTGTQTDINGAFSFTNVQPGNYKLKTVYLGYANSYRTITVASADVVVGNIAIEQAGTMLKSVEIQTNQVRVEQKGDTTQFNANAYKTNPDATAEDLVTKLPGVTNENGTVKVQGEEVKKVLVDGKPFLGDDPSAALKNVPADMIDKIQVFDKMSDQSQFTGFDDGSASKTINIVTKQGMSNGKMAKVYAGYGTDDRYTAGGNLNLFNGERKLTIMGMSNNINQQNFSMDTQGSQGRGQWGRGGMGGGGPMRPGGDQGGFVSPVQGGITTTHSLGLNYSDAWSKKIKMSGSYFFTATESENSTDLTRTYITSRDSGLVYTENNESVKENLNHRFNLRLEYNIDSSNAITLTPRYTLTATGTDASVIGRSSTSEGVIESMADNITSSDSRSYNFGNDLLYQHKFQKKGRTFSVNIGTQLNNNESNGSLLSVTTTQWDSLPSSIDQEYTQATDGATHSGNISYTEPVGKEGQVQISYAPSYTINKSDKRTYNFDPDTQLYSLPDTALTNKFDNTYTVHRGGLNYRVNIKKLNLNAGLNYQQAILEGEQQFPSSYTISRSFTSLLPEALLTWKFTEKKNLRIRYRTSTNAPSVTQLQNVVDNNNPLLLKTGNPSLKQDYAHNLFARYASSNTDKATSFFAMAYGGFTQNYIGNSTFIALQDTVIDGITLRNGTQLTRPVNLDGYYTARSFLVYSRPLSWIKSNLNLTTGFVYNSTPALVNDALNRASNYAFSQGITIASNISKEVDFTLSYTGNYSIVKNTLQEQSDNNYFSHNASAKINWIFWKQMSINTSASHTLYSGLTEGINQDFLLLNASLAYKFFKNKSLEARFSVNDILEQNQSISRTVTETYIEDSETKLLQRYFMFTLTWNMKKFNGKEPAKEGPQEGQHWKMH
jgi:hypothetical protein